MKDAGCALQDLAGSLQHKKQSLGSEMEAEELPIASQEATANGHTSIDPVSSVSYLFHIS